MNGKEVNGCIGTLISKEDERKMKQGKEATPTSVKLNTRLMTPTILTSWCSLGWTTDQQLLAGH